MFNANDSSDGAIDRAIDDVARGMTAGEPNGALRARVMARIAGPQRAWWRSPWVLSPLALAAIVMIAVVVWDRESDRGPEKAALQRRPFTIAAFTMPSSRRSSLEFNASESGRPLATHEPDAGLTPGTTYARESAVAALAPPPLDMPSIALGQLAVERITPGETIQLPELETITPITVAPIGDPQGERR